MGRTGPCQSWITGSQLAETPLVQAAIARVGTPKGPSLDPEEVAQAYGLEEDEDVLEFLSMETSVIGETDTTIIFINF